MERRPPTPDETDCSESSTPSLEPISSKRTTFTRHFTVPFKGKGKPPASSSTSSKTESGNNKGPFGLTTVFHPANLDEVLAHVVFVHGLGGGSEHTWTKDDCFWPQDLLPLQNPFQDTAIHSFGYDSDFKKSSTLNINDFSKSLLNNMLNNPIMTGSETPIILVAHSMGGLVVKRAYILAKQMSVYESVAERVKAVVFIATPHTGSNLAGILDKMFRMSSGLKPYLEDLARNSDVVQTVNAEFPSQSLGLLLHSFHETKPLSVGGLREVMIVPKSDAILNYPHEQSALLYGDHRSICKFASVEDHNFIAIWQAMASCIKVLQVRASQRPLSLISQSNEELSEYLDIWEPPVDDLYRLRADRLPGSCQWLSESTDYQEWLQQPKARIYWLRGPPGCGKSYTSGYAIEELEGIGKGCCYYFFAYGDRVKSSMEGFLVSLIWQMAVLHPDVKRRILRIVSRDRGLAKSGDYRTLLRKFWEQGILQSTLNQETYWVIDAFDECRAGQELAKFLLRVQEKFNGLIKIMVTTRNSYTDYQIPAHRITSRDIEIEDIQGDIARYLNAHSSQIPGTSLLERDSLKERILDKSNGCFLWAILVLENLGKVVGTQARLRALEEMPPGMDSLYSRIVRSMSTTEKEISKTILTWVTCATRPLTTSELKYVVERLAMDEVDDIETLVSKYCNDLLYIDKNSRVKIRHASARSFLLRRDINSELDDDLTIQKEDGHKLLALECLNYLNGPEMKIKPKRKMVAVAQERSVFASYACQALHEHVNRSSALNTDILAGLATFLRSNVLSWIEELAKTGNLETVLRFAQVLKIFLRRKSRTDLLLGEDVVVIDTWAFDLVKLVSKFGRQLLMHPESILYLIPPFCPPETAPHAQFTRGLGTAVTVSGLAARTWDDSLCTIILSEPQNIASGVIRRERLHSVATSDDNFCIGTSIGRIAVFDEKTCLEETSLNHEQPVILLQFAESKPLLASASKKLLRIWNTETWEQQWEIPTRHNVLAIAFVDDDQLLLAALRNNTILALNLIDRTTDSTSWTDVLEDPHNVWYRGIPPEQATFNTDLGLLALGYRHRHILVYNYDQESYQIFDHHNGLSEGVDEHISTGISIYAMTFSKLPETSLLAVALSCSDLVIFDTDLGTIQARISSAYFSSLVSSPDGRTLAASRMDGAIELYDFETLHKLYRIRPEDGAVAALDFSADSTRFIVIRAGGRNCRVWDPAALYRRDVGHNSVRSPSLGSGSQDGVYEERDEGINLVGAIACDATGQFFFVGKDDYSVSAYDSKTSRPITVLFSHVANIKALHFGAKGQLQLLVSVDTAGFLMVHKISKAKQQWSTECLFTHRASVTGVQQFLCNKELTYILVCSNDHAHLLSITTGKEIVPAISCKSEIGGSYIWAQHPEDPSLLVYITSSTAHVYTWDSLQNLSAGAGGIRLQTEGSLPEPGLQLGIQSANALFSGANSVLAVFYARAGQGPRGNSTCLCFAASAFSPGAATTATPLPGSQPVCDIIHTILGTYRERLVFLHKDGWVCSVKAAGILGGSATGGGSGGKTEAGSGVMHHFPPPMDWLRASRELLIRVSRLGDVLFVVNGEVASVKRGLERVAEVNPGGA